MEHFQDIGWLKADFSLTGADSADPVLAGANVNYLLDATNGGSGTDRQASVTLALPAAMSLVSAGGTGWTCSGTTSVTCTRVANGGGPDFANGAAPQISITATALAIPGTHNAAAAVNVPSPLIDPNVANNTVTIPTTIISPATIGTHTKTVAGTFAPGGTVTYTVIVGNTAGTPQLDNPGDELVDVLPPQLTLVSATATSGTALATVATNTVTRNGSIGAGGSVTITITALVDTGTGGLSVANQGTINFDADGNGTNESSVLTDDPATAGITDPTTFRVLSVLEIPTLSSLGLLLLLAGLAFAAVVLLRRRRSA